MSIDILIASVYRCIFAMKSAIVLVFSLLICIFQSRNMSTVQDIEKDFHGMSLGREVRSCTNISPNVQMPLIFLASLRIY